MDAHTAKFWELLRTAKLDQFQKHAVAIALDHLQADLTAEVNRNMVALQAQSQKTLRDEFAIHAPAQPAGWFTPKMPPKPPERWFSADGKTEFRTHRDAVRDARTAPYDANESQRTEWERERNLQYFLQWPYAYADAMLEARNK